MVLLVGWAGQCRRTYVEAVRVRLVMMGLGSCSEALGLWLLWCKTGGLAASSFSGVLGSAMAFLHCSFTCRFMRSSPFFALFLSSLQTVEAACACIYMCVCVFVGEWTAAKSVEFKATGGGLVSQQIALHLIHVYSVSLPTTSRPLS